jgi:glucose-6-phosphate 1-dehydrogenase
MTDKPISDNPTSDIKRALHPTIFVIFGITGDLASRKLLPALLTLYSKNLLPNRFEIIGFSRRYMSREEFRDYIRSRLNIRPGQFKEEDIKHFLDHMTYEQGLFDAKPAYDALAVRMNGIDDRWGQCSNKLFHLSVPPNLYEVILNSLSRSGLTEPCADETGWTRILIEKPFGNDIQTAKKLDSLLAELFEEKQIFRIDHYLAKEALQNIIAFRFSNSIFEPLWNNEHIDKVHIKLFEQVGIEGRGSFFDPLGSLRDVGQNHILMMLSLIAMNRPRSLDAEDVRHQRALALKDLKPIRPKDMKGFVVKGQYDGYTHEKGVAVTSKTETYFRIESYVNSARWKGVPFFLESGKALAETKTEIDVYFKDDPETGNQNILTFRIQPDESIRIKFFVKTPGYEFRTESKTLKFKYSDVSSFLVMPNDYERLIHDAFNGDQTLFSSTEEIMASWKYITPIVENLSSIPLSRYDKGARDID